MLCHCVTQILGCLLASYGSSVADQAGSGDVLRYFVHTVRAGPFGMNFIWPTDWSRERRYKRIDEGTSSLYNTKAVVVVVYIHILNIQVHHTVKEYSTHTMIIVLSASYRHTFLSQQPYRTVD